MCTYIHLLYYRDSQRILHIINIQFFCLQQSTSLRKAIYVVYVILMELNLTFLELTTLK